MAVVSMACPCGARIKYNEGDAPLRCTSCKKEFVSSDDVVIIEGKTPPTIVKVNPVGVKGKVTKNG